MNTNFHDNYLRYIDEIRNSYFEYSRICQQRNESQQLGNSWRLMKLHLKNNQFRQIIKNSTGNLQATRRLTNLKVTFQNGRYITFNGDRIREWIGGAKNSDPNDNVYKITGIITGISSTGRTITHTITTPIIVDFACAKLGNFARTKGVVETTKIGGYADRKRTVDYGDGTCDKTITVTTFRRTYTITVD